MIHAQRLCLLFLATSACLSTQPLRAVDVFWTGGAGTTAWGSAPSGNANWSSGFTPESSFGEKGIVGTDSPSGLLAGIAEITSGAPNVGGIGLGEREIDSLGGFVNPEPAPGTLTGQLTISGGIVNSVKTGHAAIGADGRVLVGVQGRGYLAMTGGTLNTPSVIVSGEDSSADLGKSLLSLSGNATVNVTNAHQNAPINIPDVEENFTTLGRNLRIEGPDVTFETFGRVTMESTSNYTAVITSPTDHSPISAGNIAIVNGELHVEFSGAGVNHVLGETWDLVHSDLAVVGGFTNLGEDGTVAVFGLSRPAPPGAAYRVTIMGEPGSGQTMQLEYVPEPGSAALLSLASCGLVFRRRNPLGVGP